MAVILEHHGTDSEAYERTMGRWSRKLAGLFVDFIGNGGGTNVLDVGCGTGNLTIELANSSRWEKISGIDMNAQYVADAIHSNGDPRTDFQVGDATNLPYESASYDQVMALHVLAYNLKRVISIIGIAPLIAAIRAA